MKPPVPEELMAANKELQPEGMMFVGDQGKIIGGFHGENPQIIPEAKMRAYGEAKKLPTRLARSHGAPRGGAGRRARRPGSKAFKGGPPTYGDFLLAGPISDMVNLAAISLRIGGKRLLWDAAAATITNLPDANKYLTRECRAGWAI